MQVIWHHCRSKNAPVLKLANGCFEGVEGFVICEDTLPVFNANRDEVNHAVLPRQPNRYSRRMAHARRLAGGAPALQFFFIQAVLVGQALRLLERAQMHADLGKRGNRGVALQFRSR